MTITTHTEHQKQPPVRTVSAWIGSLLFHTLLLLLVLYWFSLPSLNRGAPGERTTAVAGIKLHSGGGTRQQAEATPDNPQNADAELHKLETERIAFAILNVRPATNILAPGQLTETAQPGGGAATELTQGLLNVPGTGIDSQTGAATVQVFGQQGKGTKFVYVFDRSDSMEGRRIQMAKAELIRSLGALGDKHQFNIIFYNHAWQAWRGSPSRQLIFASPTNKQDAVRYIEGITPEGGTQHYHPLMEAVYHRPDVIFFLTDGEAVDDLTPVQIEEIGRANRGTQINVIQFGDGGFAERRSRRLQQLADENLGGYEYINVRAIP